MSDYRRQFVLFQDGRNRWRWRLFEDGMQYVAIASTGYRTFEECVQSTRVIADIASHADVWDAVHQQWHVATGRAEPTPGRRA